MKKILTLLLISISVRIQAQTVKVEIPETYELSNVILALTRYGIACPKQGSSFFNKFNYAFREFFGLFSPLPVNRGPVPVRSV